MSILAVREAVAVPFVEVAQELRQAADLGLGKGRRDREPGTELTGVSADRRRNVRRASRAAVQNCGEVLLVEVEQRVVALERHVARLARRRIEDRLRLLLRAAIDP